MAKEQFLALVLPMSPVYVWNCFIVHEGLIAFQGLWPHFVSVLGWAVQESNGFRQSLPQEESDIPREWKNIVTWLLLTLFILCKCPSYGYGAGFVIARSRKKKKKSIDFLFSPNTNMRMCIRQLLHDRSQISGKTPTGQLLTKQLGR